MRVRHVAGFVALMVPMGASTLAAQGTFEGVVTYQWTQNNNPSKPGAAMTYSVKGSKIRIEGSAGQGGSGSPMENLVGLYDETAGTMTVMLPSMKAYMDMSSNLSKGQVHMDSALGATSFKKTGSETVAGVPCDDYQATDNKGKTSFACVAHGMGNWVMLGGPMSHSGPGSPMASMFKQGAFPLKMGTIEDGKQVVQMVATSVERKTLDASLFVVPSDYQDMSKMGGALGAMMNGQKPGQP